MIRSPQNLQEAGSVLAALFENPNINFGEVDLGLLNLLCAPNLLGSELLDIATSLERLDKLTAEVGAAIDKGVSSFDYNVRMRGTGAQWRMGLLVTKVKRDFGARYSPSALADLDAGCNAPFSDASEVFIHGLLNADPNRRLGTCSSIPVLVTAIARRLGYPVRLAVARNHLYARWEESGKCFNIEASNPQGMAIYSDEHYRNWPKQITHQEMSNGYYVRSLSPAEEFAVFLQIRVACLIAAAGYGPSLPWAARALQLSPDDPHFSTAAYLMAEHAVYQRNYVKYPGRKIPRRGEGRPGFVNIGDLLDREERSWFMTIQGHYYESLGELNQARRYFEVACQQRFDGYHEQRDLQRFLHKYGSPPKSKPLSLPENLGFPRRIRLFCKAEQEAEALRRLVDQFEGDGELVKARDALHDLYMFDPGDGGVFEQARAIESRPQFGEQFKHICEKRRRLLQHQAVPEICSKRRVHHVIRSDGKSMDNGRPGQLY